MDIVITESQNDRIIEMMKQYANQYSEERVIRTEVEIGYNRERGLYLIYPIFYVKNKEKFPHHIYKHMLAQRMEDMFGVPVHSGSPKVIEI